MVKSNFPSHVRAFRTVLFSARFETAVTLLCGEESSQKAVGALSVADALRLNGMVCELLLPASLAYSAVSCLGNNSGVTTAG